MKVILSPSKLNGTVCAPPSKSCMHRTLICAAAADRPTKIICSSYSKDTLATIGCLKALGAKFEEFDGGIIVYPIEKGQNGECILDCNESGSTLRFMLPFAAALGKTEDAEYFEKIGINCPKCGKDIVMKKTKKGRRYFGCIDNPDCDFMVWQKPSGSNCPHCGSLLLEKGNKRVCMDERCGFVTAAPTENNNAE